MTRPLSHLCILALSLAFAVVATHGSAGAKPKAKPKAQPKAPAKPKPPAKPAPYRPGPLLTRFLDGPMKGVDEIIFAVRVPGRDHWYVTFGNYSDHSEYSKSRGFKFQDGVYWGYAEGGRLCRMNLRTGKLTRLLDDPKGGVRDPQMHYSGKKILVSYRRGGEHPFHLYEINIDGSGLRQLTDGPDDDIEPAYCPDGSIVFCSSRCRRYVNCWYTRVATLYRCDGDGGNIRMLSSNNDHDNTPWVLPDGRILYMRWEYVDRSQVHYHHLWTMNPDGTNQMVYFGNSFGGIAMLDAKPIPATNKVVVSYSPGHGRSEHFGPVTIVDPTIGPDVQASAKRISRESDWKDPYAFSEDCFLVANRKGIFVMDGKGKSELVHALPANERHLQCHEPRPLRPRAHERVIPDRTNLAKPTGRLVLADIYHGRKMASVKRGSIKKLLVLQQVPKPVNHSGGMQPLTIGGSFTLAQILGTVPVEPDGSAYFDVPALKSVFFVALDANDRAVKRMHSFAALQPGETTSCVGCHEQRTETPRHSLLAALDAVKRPPSLPKKPRFVPDVIDFPRDIQPILDRHCVTCHNPDKYTAKVDLTGDKTPMYTMSYWAMQLPGLVADNRNRPQSNYDPYVIGSGAARLMKKIDGSHHKVKVTEREHTLIRLWIDTSACYPGTYASLGCGSYPVGLGGKTGAEIRKRCGQCHTRDHVDGRTRKKTKVVVFPKQRGSMGTVYNLSRPEKSRLLTAMLAKEAGGLSLKGKVVFKTRNDPLYLAILAQLRKAHNQLVAGKRFDMPGFRPNPHYIREMQRYGILPHDLKPNVPVDPYATDRAYWASFDYQPAVAVK
ncbi:MAG: PD40 domain-containing protein [Candidatus Brocadiae bacterium]|nr:PD40 domain-containing protein [Candidatus Brocadiia bacterium]